MKAPSCRSIRLMMAIFSLAAAGGNLQAQDAAANSSTNRPIDLDTPRGFPEISSASEWDQRATEIRQQVLVSCGLWPMPEKTPLKPQIFGKIERDGYTVEKVYFETWPGLYLAGNLYRPTGRGHGPFPGILNPHGHWSNGRMADTKDGSIAGRCISFARQGMVAFSYDMIGYNDTHFADASSAQSFSDIHHQVATNKTDLLWNISLMGLQTWNSVRALDFLESLPDVDRKRLACTGESGGGTQTFMLGAVDSRLAAQAPVVMVSHIMQGGCLCENAPGLRVQYSNMEIDAAAAPRPQILVAATGDWTKDTPTVEGPAIAHIYQLKGHPDRFTYQQFNFDHNYNQTSREAVYAWFGKWLLGAKDPDALKEKPFQKEPDSELRVFPNNELPQGAMAMDQFLGNLRALHRREWRSLVPRDKDGLKRYQSVMRPAWRHTLQLDLHTTKPKVEHEKMVSGTGYDSQAIVITPSGEAQGVPCTYWAPSHLLEERNPRLVILAAGQTSPHADTNATPPASAMPFLQHGMAVLSLNYYVSDSKFDQFTNFFATYNRTQLQQLVNELVLACSAAGSIESRKPLSFHVTLVGEGRAGLLALLAAPAADSAIADCDGFDVADESAFLAPDIYCPGILAMGGFEGAAILAIPHALLLHNVGPKFATDSIEAAYKSTGYPGKLTLESRRLSPTDLIDKITQF